MATTPADDRPGRFRLGREIGRGGLGRVVEAYDAVLKRTVAVKLVLDNLPPDLRDRFLREAELTARLEHPNIVPVHDLIDGEGGPRLLMKRVSGRDLATLLRALAEGNEAAGAAWSRARLLRVFQDICLGVAFAHDQGVIHRDLKPSNVMIGDYGETLIVDWGLAKELGGAVEGEPVGEPLLPPPAASATGATLVPGRPPSSSAPTLEGSVLGTPAYMSPEQASGRIAELDERSDVYSLGAILYEILTFRPPVEGGSAAEVVSRVKTGKVAPPSQATAGRLPAAVPPELDAIVMRALAFRKEDRYASARALHDDVQLYLEGVKEKERQHRFAEDAVARAREAMERHRTLRESVRQAESEAVAAAKRARPREEKTGLWNLQDRARALRRQAVDAFAEANACLAQARGHDREHAEARRLTAELFWGRFLEAEQSGEEAEAILARRMVEQFNDGSFDARLRGDGTLTVRTRAYSCACLREGRTVPPEGIVALGHHLFSGRLVGGPPGSEGLPELEPQAPVNLKVHGPDCERVDVEGADAWLWKYEEVGRILKAVTPPRMDAARGGGPAPTAGLFTTDSPFTPEGKGAYLGKTPIERLPIPMGSWLLVLARPGSSPVRCPVSVSRSADVVQDVTLFREDEIPAGFVQVPAGGFVFQGDRGSAQYSPAQASELDDFFIARDPVSCRQYCEFLNALAAVRPEEARAHVPREAQASGHQWPGPPFVVPTAEWLARAEPAARAQAARLTNCGADWEEDWPILGIAWEDAMAFCAWWRGQSGGAETLAHELEWEKAARGTDARIYPFGNHFDERWCNMNRSQEGPLRPAPIGSFPADESPYGVRGLAGNARDICLNCPPEFPAYRIGRGGYWTAAEINCRAAARGGIPLRLTADVTGIRMVRPVRLGSPNPYRVG